MEGEARVSVVTTSRFRDVICSPKLLSWTKLLTRFLSLEVIVQALGFASGVFLVRVLPKAEYGIFTIANTMQQTMNLLADNGISSGLTAIGGRVWNDRFRFGQLLHTAMRLRRVLALVTIVVVTPILMWMLCSNGSSLSYAGLVSAIVLLGLYFQLSVGVLIVAPRLHLEVNRIQLLGVWSAALRFVLLLVAYMTAMGVGGESTTALNTAVALLAGTLSFAMQELLLRRWVPRLADMHAPVNDDDKREILNIVRTQAPNSIYYCIQSQLTIWLIGIFGSTTAVADVGALGRIGILFLMIASVMGNVVFPRFARVQDATILWKRYWQILGGFCVIAGVMLVFTATFPQVLLWVLGPKYAHLEQELFLMILSSVLLSIMGVMWQLNVTRGWIISPWVLIPTAIATQVILIALLDLSKIRDVLLLNIFATIPAFFLNFWRTRRGIRDALHAAGQVNGGQS
jgi:O-antigen/teichoic acid export membrane protein